MTEATYAAATRFDFILDAQRRQSAGPQDKVLAETKSFAVIPSLGSLVPGWLLVVPKRRSLNCSSLSYEERVELDSIVRNLQIALQRFGGSCFAFEHGASYVGSLTGCGVDQAHLHVVPLSFDLLALASRATGWQIRSYSSMSDLIEGPTMEYIMVSDVARKQGIIGHLSHPTSQWVRKLIATELGPARNWDYRQSPNHEIILETVRALDSKLCLGPDNFSSASQRAKRTFRRSRLE